MRLAGIELHGFRSIGDEPVILRPWRKCNILVGQNNSGKSNVIEAVTRICRAAAKEHTELVPLDCHRRDEAAPFHFAVDLECDEPEDAELKALLDGQPLSFDFKWECPNSLPVVTVMDLGDLLADFGRADRLLRHLASGEHFTSRGDPSMRRKVFRERSASIWDRYRAVVPSAQMVGEFRQILPGKEYNVQGSGLIEMLKRWQHPDPPNDEDRLKFDRIEDCVRRLLHLPNACIEVTEKPQLMLKDDVRLPLRYYGTGVHQLVILLTAVLSVDGALCCIEEPEIHLHPRLQREFIDFLLTETANQYLISTHSPTFINAVETDDRIQVFHIRKHNGATVGRPILTREGGLRALRELGVKASDILQANCVVWVEGPSDRIYVRRWLHMVAPDLVDGHDYVVMPYGSSGLLKHMCAADSGGEEELIDILRINQNASVIMDSDRSGPDSSIAAYKERVDKECRQAGGLCWITDGRAIENYLSSALVSQTLTDWFGQSMAVSVEPFTDFGQAVDAAVAQAGLPGPKFSGRRVEYASKFAERIRPESMGSDLRQRIDELVEWIKRCNA